MTVENLDKNSSRSYLTYTDTPVKIMKVVSEVNSENIGLTYDFAHSYLADKNRFKENSKFAAIHASHLHLSDNFGIP
ncbi:MAG: TIM barrel protein [Kosmotogaceae bacterium]